jgi:hypothetical protein
MYKAFGYHIFHRNLGHSGNTAYQELLRRLNVISRVLNLNEISFYN